MVSGSLPGFWSGPAGVELSVGTPYVYSRGVTDQQELRTRSRAFIKPRRLDFNIENTRRGKITHLTYSSHDCRHITLVVIFYI